MNRRDALKTAFLASATLLMDGCKKKKKPLSPETISHIAEPVYLICVSPNHKEIPIFAKDALIGREGYFEKSAALDQEDGMAMLQELALL